MAKRTLRPMGYAEILDEVFDLYRKNFWVLVAITAVINIFQYLALYNLNGESRNIVNYLLAYPLTALSSGAIIYAISTCYLQGTPTITSSYRAMLPKTIRLIVTGLLSMAMIFAGYMFLVIPGIIVFVYLAFAYQVVVLEDIAYFKALRRSYDLVRGQWGRVFTLLALGLSISWLIEMAITMPAVYSSTGKWRIFAGDQGTLPLVVNYAISLLTTPIYSIASVLIYYDLRVRKEGFDLELLAKEMKVSVPPHGKATAGSEIVGK